MDMLVTFQEIAEVLSNKYPKEYEIAVLTAINTKQQNRIQELEKQVYDLTTETSVTPQETS